MKKISALIIVISMAGFGFADDHKGKKKIIQIK